MRMSDWSSDVCSSDLQGFDCSDMLDPKILSIGECRHQFGGQPRKVEVTTKPAFSDIYPLGHDLLPPLIIGIQSAEIITCAFQIRQIITSAVFNVRNP